MLFRSKHKKHKDAEKIKYFKDKGIKIITVKEGNKNFVEGDIVEYIYHSTDKTSLNFVIKSLFDLIGITFNKNIDVISDTSKILEQYIESEKYNSIAVKCPKSVIE